MSYFRTFSILVFLLIITYIVILSIFYISPDLESRKYNYLNKRNNNDAIKRIELKNKKLIEKINKPPNLPIFNHEDVIAEEPNSIISNYLKSDTLTSISTQNPVKDSHMTDTVIVPTILASVISNLKTTLGLPVVMKNPAIVIIHYNRLHYLTQTIASLSNLANIKDYKVYLSQDGPNNEAKLLAEKYKFSFLEHRRDAMANAGGTTYLARHYKRALDELFLKNDHSHVIIVEDDMIFSPDFLDFFEASAPLLETDPTLWCASSWNDMGINNLVYDSKRLFRTDFFSGLGWMLTKAIWTELSPKFPRDQWDWWMRANTNSKNRECIVPEVSRNKNIGSEGVNVHSGPFFHYLESIAWVNSESKNGLTRENGGFGDTSYIIKDNYEKLLKLVFSAAMSEFVLEQKILSASDIGNIIDGSKRGGYIGHIHAGNMEPLHALSSSRGYFNEDMSIEVYDRAIHLFPQKSSVFIGTFNRDDFDIIKSLFKFESLRSTHNGLVIVRINAHVLILANVKTAVYLPESILKSAPKSLYDPYIILFTHCRSAQKSKISESCYSACSAKGKSCDQNSFEYINDCTILAQHFACEGGCMGGVAGEDIPNYISSNSKPEFYQMCLTTPFRSKCEASHITAERLCPCV